jgi:hypothetical protein
MGISEEHAFDAAIKSWNDPLYSRRANLDGLKSRDALIAIREWFNEALALEGRNITDHAPHPPFYFDYIDSDHSNALAFADNAHSFIGVTVPLINERRVPPMP